MVALPLAMICSFNTPPLMSNQREHWSDIAKIKRKIRDEASWLARSIRSRNPDGWPIPGPVMVRLVWVVTDRRRRDVGASTPTLKAWIDGLVDGGMLSGDHWEVVDEESYRIQWDSMPRVMVEIHASRN